MQSAVISIDLGASFTKVGFRTACTPAIGQPYTENTQLLTLEGSVLIPSLAIRTMDRKHPWLFGPVAADMHPGKGMVVYSNWKAGLFSRANNPSAAQAAIVAQAFFAWLRPHVEGAIGSLEDKIVRIMLPAFRDFDTLAAVTKQCMEMAGWCPQELVVATEPHANSIGVLTRGRNVSTKGTKGEFLDFSKMFGSGNPYIEMARAAVLQRHGQRSMRIGLVDVGAFTTDLALLKFNLVSPPEAGDGLRTVTQESFEIGTHKNLDEPFWAKLSEHHGANFPAMSFREREETKRTLFAGDTFAVLIGSKRVTLGDETDAKMVHRVAGEFAKAIWNKVGALIERAETDAVYLTGGGAGIKLVADALETLCPRLHTVPSNISLRASNGDKLRFIDWLNTDGSLERVATALGGASLLAPVTLNSAPVIARHRNSLRSQDDERDERLDRFRMCTCHGNPDCPKCGGSGYLS